MIEISERDGSIVFAVRVTPRTSRDAIEGEYQGALKIRLTAPPVEDRANDALRRFLAARLNVPVSAVRIVSGEKSRNKRVAVAGVTRAQVISLATVAEDEKQLTRTTRIPKTWWTLKRFNRNSAPAKLTAGFSTIITAAIPSPTSF